MIDAFRLNLIWLFPILIHPREGLHNLNYWSKEEANMSLQCFILILLYLVPCFSQMKMFCILTFYLYTYKTIDIYI